VDVRHVLLEKINNKSDQAQNFETDFAN